MSVYIWCLKHVSALMLKTKLSYLILSVSEQLYERILKISSGMGVESIRLFSARFTERRTNRTPFEGYNYQYF